ncbi:MAG: hypothetical protein QM535_16150 [Limnohabitans sp.]|nr:hypothetical protein [Limnohabitans sp.]
MDKDKILANVASLTAEQLFDEIKSGNVTLEELINTGNLGALKRNKINKLQLQLVSKEDNDWKTAKDGNTESTINKYLKEYPDGRYVNDAEQLIDKLQTQRKQADDYKNSILKDIKTNPNTYSSGEIINLLKNTITKDDLLNCGIPLSAIENLNKIVTHNLRIGETPTSIPKGFTEVYFWGTPGSGKTCALGAVLRKALDKGYLNILTGPGIYYATQLHDIFSDDNKANDFLPSPTPVEKTQYLPFTLNRKNERSLRSVALIELSGEIFECFFNKNSELNLLTKSHEVAFDSLNTFLKSTNRKIHFFFVEFKNDNIPDKKGVTQNTYLTAASNYFNNNKIFSNTTDAIFIVLTKSDLLRDESGNSVSSKNRLNYAKIHLENNYKAFINTLRTICKKESINAGTLQFVPFTLGNVYFQKICNFDGKAAEEIVEILMDRIPVKKSNIFDIFKK